MARYLLSFFILLFSGTIALAQTSLYGKVTEEDSGEVLPFATVAIYKNGVLQTGSETDFDGNYSFSNIDPGTYDLEVSYTGYQSTRIADVQVSAGKANKVDVKLGTGGGVTLDEIVVVEYEVPLIEQDNTTSGATITSEQIKQLPTRNINALAATSAGLSSADEGDAITVRGSRSNATDYYVDGIRVQGSLIPESEIEQLQVITGGIEAQYGDVTGGIISITTKGPSSKFSGGIEAETSKFLDPFENSLIGFNLSGPIARNKQGQSILGFRVAGRYTYRLDDDPTSVELARVKTDKLAELEANPILNVGGSPVVAANFLRDEDVELLDYRPNEERSQIDVTAKIDARLSKAIDITLTGAYRNSENLFTPTFNAIPRGFRLMNSHNNPKTFSEDYRFNFRFRHRLGAGASSDPESRSQKASVIQNATYTLQAGFEKEFGDTWDSRHEDNYFRYGHVGNFDISWRPAWRIEFDPFTGVPNNFVHIDNTRVFNNYTPGTTNPVLANYNKFYGEGADIDPDNYPDNIESFIAPNGAISTIFNNSWNFHSNVGSVYNVVNNSENDTYTFNANASFDLLPGGSDKGRHNIAFGIYYEQRIDRGYSVNPRNLWNIARQLQNNHILGIPTDELGNPTSAVIGSQIPTDFNGNPIEGFGEFPLYDVEISPGEDNLFYERIRQVTGAGLNEFVNVDALSPDQLSLDMFSPAELNDQFLIDYFGTDYLGNNFDGNFEDFFTETLDVGGRTVRAFPVAPNRPIYTAAFIQDKFTFRDIIFRLGVRVDRYDANTKVLKDNYSLYEIVGAGDYHSQVGTQRPGNIGEDFKVYLNESGGSRVVAYRDGDNWFQGDGTAVNDATQIDEIRSGLVFPQYVDPRANEETNYIKARDFNVDASFEDYEVQVNVMPRLAFSFPISDAANFFAHYDILVQRPPSNTIGTAKDYYYFVEDGNTRNNPNLRPERTIDYEVGFQQRLSQTSAIKISAYYKELRDMIQQRVFFPVPLVSQYTTFDNQDFGTVKGFSFNYDLRRTQNISVQANYTLQFADGTGSNANSQQGLNNRGNLRTLFPLSFDERHRINAVIDFRYGKGKRYNGPQLFGKDIFQNAGINLQAIAVSGRPYTARSLPRELGGVGTVGSLNGARKPWNFTLNLRVDKSFTIADKLGMNVYLRVSNVLDRRNVINVYSASGSPTDDGFLLSARGQDQVDAITGNPIQELGAYLASYQWALVNPGFFSLPRRIFLGAIVDF